MTKLSTCNERLESILRIALEALDADHAEFFRLDPVEKLLRLEVAIDSDPAVVASRNDQTFSADDDQCVHGWVCRNLTTLNASDVRKDSRGSKIDPVFRSGLWAPVATEGRLEGVVSALRRQSKAFDVKDECVIGLVASQIAAAVDAERKLKATETQLEQLAVLHELDRTLNSMVELQPLLQTVLLSLEGLVAHDSAAILLVDGAKLRCAAAWGRGQAALGRLALEVAETVATQQLVESQRSARIDDLSELPKLAPIPDFEFARSCLIASLSARGNVIGQIQLFSAYVKAFDTEHCDLLQGFANHAAIAVANALLIADLNEQARLDSLTRVLNHGRFVDELRALCRRDVSLAMIMLDLDDFKRYNDKYGHLVGDQVLRVTVQAIRAHIKQTDVVGRWGGDEFGIVLRAADGAQASKVAERIRTTLSSTRIALQSNQLIPAPTASQGIAAIPESANDADDLIHMADRAMYRAKSYGRDRVARSETDLSSPSLPLFE